MKIFVPGRGQYDNVGDIMLRRQLLDWMRDFGAIHTYVGLAPDGYSEGLQLRAEDVVYDSFTGWYGAGLRTALRGEASYVFKPGEIQLSLVGMKEHLSMLPLLVAIRVRGGKIIRVGSGSRNFAPLPRLLMGPSIRLAHLTAWRDQVTADYLGVGSVMPDLAFGEGRPSPELDGTGAAAGRNTLVVSMRSDRPLPGADWFAGVRQLARRQALTISVVSQVFRDRDRSRELASGLEAELLDWDGTRHHEHEERLRALYSRSALVLSDRLHVLIAGFTEGAVPSAAIGAGSAKIDRHFRAAGVQGVSVDVSALDAAALEQVLTDMLARRSELFTALRGAREDLARVRAQVREVFAGAALPATLTR